MERIKKEISRNLELSNKEKNILLQMVNNILINEDYYGREDIFDKIIERGLKRDE